MHNSPPTSVEYPGFNFRYMSWGVGVQSSAMLIMAGLGKIQKPDVAIFADTQDEPQWVYDYLGLLTPWAAERGIPVHIVTIGKLSQHVIERHNGTRKRFAALPVWTRAEDGRACPLRRQCTREYKIDPIERKVRELLGYKPRQRIKEKVAAYIGISCDEATRMKPSRTPWVTNQHPLIDLQLRRQDCISYILKAGLPAPKKSSCVFCPFHSDRFWKDLQENHPKEFQRAVEFDLAVRDMTKSGMRNPVFVHRSLRPLEELHFDHAVSFQDLWGSWDNECEGYCGV